MAKIWYLHRFALCIYSFQMARWSVALLLIYYEQFRQITLMSNLKFVLPVFCCWRCCCAIADFSSLCVTVLAIKHKWLLLSRYTKFIDCTYACIVCVSIYSRISVSTYFLFQTCIMFETSGRMREHAIMLLYMSTECGERTRTKKMVRKYSAVDKYNVKLI